MTRIINIFKLIRKISYYFTLILALYSSIFLTIQLRYDGCTWYEIYLAFRGMFLILAAVIVKALFDINIFEYIALVPE